MDLAHVFLRYFFETEYMHFGYWEPTDKINFLSLKQAQERYVSKLLQMIPDDVKSVLDVGCGSGEMAKELVEQGYKVDVIAPPSVMTSFARDKLAGKANIYECKFEDFDIGKRYDLVIFSESFQFIKQEAAIAKGLEYSNKYVLIADVFKKSKERGPIGGGHQYNDFINLLHQYNLTEVNNLDVTQHIAPQFDLEADLMQNFIKPMCLVGKRIYTVNRSIWLRILLWFNRKRLGKLQGKYLNNKNRNGAAFAQYKTYRFMLLQASGVGV